MGMGDVAPNLLVAFVAMIGFGLLILAVITVTSFVKISVVLFLLRNALGVQQSPPNIVLYAIALILTVFISLPLFQAEYQIFIDAGGRAAGGWRNGPTLRVKCKRHSKRSCCVSRRKRSGTSSSTRQRGCGRRTCVRRT